MTANRSRTPATRCSLPRRNGSDRSDEYEATAGDENGTRTHDENRTRTDQVNEATSEDRDAPGTVAAGVSALTLVTAFGLLALGVEWFWVAFPVGYGGVLPVATALAARRRERTDGSDDRVSDAEAREAAALRDLRRRYVQGELTDGEFERRVEDLLADGNLLADTDRRGRSERRDPNV